MSHFLHILGYIALGIVGLVFAVIVLGVVGLDNAEANGENPFE